MRPAAMRASIVATVLVLTIALAALLTIRAISAERYHRTSTEQVLRDYAALGAEGLAGRLRNALTARLYPVLTAGATAPQLAPRALDALRTSMMGVARETADSATRLLRVDTTSNTAFSAGKPLSAADARAIVDAVRATARTLPALSYFGFAWVGSDLIVFQPDRSTPPRRELTALSVPVSAVALFVRRAVTAAPVLPPSLSHGASVDSGVQVRVRRDAGELLTVGTIPDSPFRASRPLGLGYGDLAVEVSIGEAIVPRLIAFGLPESRGPLLWAVLFLIVVMVLTLADQLRRERQLVRLRDDFVASTSHELRTPLAQIRLFAETLRLARVRSPEEGERSLAIIENEARRLEHLVGNLLHFARHDKAIPTVNVEPTDLSALLGDVASEFAPLAERGGSTIQSQIAPGIHMNVDRGAVRQMVLNLLDNAVKYGRKGQAIGLRLAVDSRQASIEVSDEGEGIPDRERTRVFQRFWRGDGARRAGITGTGIGLAIVSDVARMHGGSVTVEPGAGRGTHISVLLPRSVG
jgi:signal transduction histidine kinase